MPLEVVNVVWQLQKRRRLSARQADEIIAKTARLRIHIHAEAVPMQTLLGIARDHDLAAYDASFIELAQRLGLPLAAKDAMLLAAARRAGVPAA